MSWARRLAGLLLVVPVMVSAVACTASSDNDEGAASCAYQVLYQGRTYQGVANVKFIAGKELGNATIPPCNDTGGQDKSDDTETQETAYTVNGISPEVAIAVGDTPNEAKLVAAYSGKELPAEIKKLIDGS
ncbi:MAG TPA: DUF6281 family protein [Streptomyces sp.]